VAPKKVPAAKKVAAVSHHLTYLNLCAVKLTSHCQAPNAKTGRPAKAKAVPAINEIPTERLDVFVFGEGSAGELGLGAKKYDGGKKPVDVKRPRLNHLLPAKVVGVVQLAVGGMHCAALTHDNKILTWGVNDQGALGREAKQEGKMKDLPKEDESDSDSDDEGEGLNPSEAEPRPVDPEHFPEGTKFAQLVASDSATFVVTDTGLVYGWGTFRVSLLLLPSISIISNISRAMMASSASETASPPSARPL
jgi:regulator of chromosome condensation